jgi:chorismate synthase
MNQDPPRSAGATPPEIDPGEIAIRPLRTNAEYLECVALQKQIWGAGFTEQVPLAILKVGQRVGGVTAGAFDRHGRMIGFVFGLTGVEQGRLVHWSDMLAVLPDTRDQGVGRRLKAFQRSQLQAIGVELMYWTFDPLVARNAHLNLVVLGASVIEYAVDMYGIDTSSELHRGVGTDRLVVVWPLTGGTSNQMRPESDLDAAPLLQEIDGCPVLDLAALAPLQIERAYIEVPRDIEALQRTSVAAATEWRLATREAFVAALEGGWRIQTFLRTTEAGSGRYLLNRPAK